MKIAVIGARGFVGRRILEALESVGVEALDPVVDLQAPATFVRLEGHDAVIDAAAPGPRADLVAHCLERGLRLIDCSAHAPTTRALLASTSRESSGLVVVGAGLFPGVSNLLAAREPDCRAILVELDPLSGAGPGTINSLTGALADPRLRCERAAGRRALAIESSDAALASRPLELWITTRQRWLARLLPAAAWLGRRRFVGRLTAGAANLGMKLLRAVILRRRAAAIALHTVDRAGVAREQFRSADGFGALARAVAWAAICAARRPDLCGVVRFVDLASQCLSHNCVVDQAVESRELRVRPEQPRRVSHSRLLTLDS